MAGESLSSNKTPERLLRLYRDFNIVGAVALGGAAVLFPVGAAVLGPLAALNALQAGGAEAVLQYTKHKKNK